jgi:hypothetical protein
VVAAARKMNWCFRCHHAIVPGGLGKWEHFSDDDWSGHDCECANRLSPCRPQSPRRYLSSSPVPSAPRLWSRGWARVYVN